MNKHMASTLFPERLEGATLSAPEQARDFSPALGRCRPEPLRAVILVVTNEQGCETVFGFAQYPEEQRDINSRVLLETPVGKRWFFRDFVDSTDPRYRRIVKRFVDSGCLEEEEDEFVR